MLELIYEKLKTLGMKFHNKLLILNNKRLERKIQKEIRVRSK